MTRYDYQKIQAIIKDYNNQRATLIMMHQTAEKELWDKFKAKIDELTSIKTEKPECW